jgi:hypothetical protein
MTPLEILSKKGEVAILERADGKSMVRIRFPSGDVASLAYGPKEQLLKELCQMCKNRPNALRQ